jgi:hypothetical protein
VKPNLSEFTPSERNIIQSNRTPRQVHTWLRSLPYNFEKGKKTMRSFRRVVSDQTAHCLEAALAAACILEQHNYPPLLLSLDSTDDLGHVVFLFRHNGLWGSVGRSRDAGLHSRKPMFRTARDVAMSYFDPYVDFTGRINGYAVVHLDEIGNYDWRFNARNLWKLHDWLVDYEHIRIQSSDKRYEQLLNRYKEFKQQHPAQQATYYDNKHTWMEPWH